MENQAKTFAREATGLVRTLGFVDQFIISQAIIVVVNGFVLTFLFAPVFFPGANIGLVFALGSIPAFAMSYVYAKMSAGMPRSGGDYVWSTRILGPIYGSVQFIFLMITTLIVGITLSTWSNVSIALAQLVYAVGVTTSNTGMVNFAISLGQTGLNTGYLIATLLIVLYIVIAVFGLRVYSWFQRAGIFLYYISTAGFIGVLLLIDSNTIPGLFNSAMAAGGSTITYSFVTSHATSVPSDWVTPSVLAAIPWGFLTFTGFNYGAYLAGETRSIKSSMWRSLFVSVIVTVVLLLAMSFLVYRDFSADFINGASYIQANAGSLGVSFPTLPTTSFLASITSPGAAIFVGLSLLIGWLIVCVAYIVTISRMIFAASFDRLLPNALANVSDRLHSPRNAVIVAGVLSWIFVSIYMLSNSFFVTWLQLGLIAPIGYLMPLFAAMVFPFVKKDLFKSTVGQFGSAAGLAVTGLIGVAAFAFYLFALSVPLGGPLGTVFLGSNELLAYSIVAIVIIAGVVMFAWAKSHASSIGVDLKRVYSEIPPE